MTTRVLYANALLYRTQCEVNLANQRLWVAVFTAEGSTAKWNPGDTTRTEPGESVYNTFGSNEHVWNYALATEGIDATAKTIMQANMAKLYSALKVNRMIGGKTRYDCVALGRLFSLIGWASLGDIVPMDLCGEYEKSNTQWQLDAQHPVSGNGEWPFYPNGAPFKAV